jgi:uncharacterized alpha/beta hydrolase family protein
MMVIIVSVIIIIIIIIIIIRKIPFSAQPAPSRFEVKNELVCTSTPHINLHGEQRDKFSGVFAYRRKVSTTCVMYVRQSVFSCS